MYTGKEIEDAYEIHEIKYSLPKIVFDNLLIPFEISEAPRFFTEIRYHWAQKYIYFLYIECILDAYNYGEYFLPDNEINRAEFLKMVVNLKKLDLQKPIKEYELPFKDANPDLWYYKYLLIGKENGLITGYENGDFMPDNFIGRAEAIVMVIKAFNFTDQGDLIFNPFHDVTENWAIPSIVAAYNLGFIRGYNDEYGEFSGMFYPNKKLTRAEASKIVYSVYEYNRHGFFTNSYCKKKTIIQN